MTALKATGLAKSYKSRQVVRDLSLELASGEVVGLLGPNGAGKTTAFYMIVGLVPCDAGRIVLGNVDVTLLPIHRRAQLGLGYLPQEASVFRKLSAEANIMMPVEGVWAQRAGSCGFSHTRRGKAPHRRCIHTAPGSGFQCSMLPPGCTISKGLRLASPTRMTR